MIFRKLQIRLLYSALKYGSFSPVRQEIVGNLITPFIYPLLSFSMKNLERKEFDASLRSIICPNDDARDILVWKDSRYFLAWVRRIYLSQYYSDDVERIRRELGINKRDLKPPLLSYNVIENKFNLFSHPTKQENNENDDESCSFEINQNQSKNNEEDNDKILDLIHRKTVLNNKEQTRQEALWISLKEKNSFDVSEWSVKDVLEAGGACLHGRGSLNWFCEDGDIYEIHTKEYIETLSKYLYSRGLSYSHLNPVDQADSNRKTIKILEIGAGMGILRHYITKQLEEDRTKYTNKDSESGSANNEPTKKNVSLEYIATDRKGEFLTSFFYKDCVLSMDFRKALKRYNPDIVICSWMPMSEDWSQVIRNNPHVKEYILIGEWWDGCVGNNWFTWGNPHFMPKPKSQNSSITTLKRAQNMKSLSPRKNQNVDNSQKVLSQFSKGDLEKYSLSNHSPFGSDGFVQREIKQLSKWQLSRYDTFYSCEKDTSTSSDGNENKEKNSPNNKIGTQSLSRFESCSRTFAFIRQQQNPYDLVQNP